MQSNREPSLDPSAFPTKHLDKVTYYDYNTDKEVLIAYRYAYPSGVMQVHNTFRISKGDIQEVIKVLSAVKDGGSHVEYSE